jgi:hypothetical protein
MSERHEIWKAADGLQMTLRSASAQLVELRARLAGLELPDASSVVCPRCGVKRPGERTLSEHVHVSHDGPVPAHWLAVEQRSLDPETVT